MGCKSCAEKAKRRKVEFLKQQKQREARENITPTDTKAYSDAIKKLRK